MYKVLYYSLQNNNSLAKSILSGSLSFSNDVLNEARVTVGRLGKKVESWKGWHAKREEVYLFFIKGSESSVTACLPKLIVRLIAISWVSQFPYSLQGPGVFPRY